MYTVVVNGTCGSVTSRLRSPYSKYSTRDIPSIRPILPCAPEQIISFTVTASGQISLICGERTGYRLLPAETNTTLAINNIDAGDAGTYDVVVTNGCGDVTSNGAVLTVATSPVITGQPQDRDLCEGSDVTFTVTATGTGLTLQWRKDGVAIPGETAADLNLTGISVSDAGNYDVILYGMCDTLISNAAELIVYRATVADIVEDDVLVCAGDDVEFNVTADGEGFLSYQWQLYYYGAWVDIADNSKYSGTNTSKLTVNNVEAADSGDYRVQVFAGCGSVFSEPVKLDVNVIIATIGTPAPFMINSATTSIEVGIKVTGHFLIFDMGFALVAPDGTEVMLKSPNPTPAFTTVPLT